MPTLPWRDDGGYELPRDVQGPPMPPDGWDPNQPAVDWTDSLGAAFRRNSSLVSYLNDRRLDPHVVEPGYKWGDGVPPDLLEKHGDLFADVWNSKARDSLIEELRRGERDEDMISKAGPVLGTAMRIGAGLFGPETMLPAGAVVKGVKGGYSLAKSSLSFAAGGAVGGAANEYLLSQSQPGHEASDYVGPVAAGTVLGGLLGPGLAKLMTRAEWQAAEKAMDAHLDSVSGGTAAGQRGAVAALDPARAQMTVKPEAPVSGLPNGSAPGEAASAGAAAVEKLTKEDLTIANPAQRAIIERLPINPDQRANVSEDPLVREVMQKLTPNPFPQRFNEEGGSLGPSVAAAVYASSRGKLQAAVRDVNDIFRDYRKAGGVMNKGRFLEEVGDALNMGDAHADPHVTQAAEAMRASLYAPYEKEAKAVRLLPEDIELKYVESYAPHFWNHRKVVQEEFRLRDDVLMPYFQEAAKRWDYALAMETQRRLDKINRAIKDKEAKAQARADYYSNREQDTALAMARRQESQRRRVDLGEAGLYQDLGQPVEPLGQRGKAATGEAADDPFGGAGMGETWAGSAGEGEAMPGLPQGSRSGMTDRDILEAAHALRSGQLKKPKVETLTQFVHRSGGLVDEGGELERMGITPKTRPGFVKRKVRTDMDRKGGWTFDDMARAAWEEGFFPEHAERPSVREFLDALDGDFNRYNRVVRETDREAVRTLDTIEDLESALARMGVDIKSPNLATNADLESLLPKVWNALDEADRQRIEGFRKRRLQIEDDLAQGKLVQGENARKRVLLADVDRFRDDVLNQADDYREFAKMAARVTVDHILGRGDVQADLPTNVVPVPFGPFKSRVINLPYATKREWLQRNAFEVADLYSRTVAGQIETKRKFGTLDLKNEIETIRENYDQFKRSVADAATAADKLALLERSPGMGDRLRAWIGEKGGGDPNKLTTAAINEFLDRQLKVAIEDINDVNEMNLGRYGGRYMTTDWGQKGLRIARSLNAYNYLRLMGGYVLANMNDVVKPIVHYGIVPYFKAGILPWITRSASFKASRADWRALGLATDHALNGMLMHGTDLLDPTAQGTLLERLLSKASNAFSVVNGSTIMNDVLHSLTAGVAEYDLTKAIMRVGDPKRWAEVSKLRADMDAVPLRMDAQGNPSRSPTAALNPNYEATRQALAEKLQAAEAKVMGDLKRDLGYLGSRGISLDDARSMADQIGQHGKTEQGVLRPNLSAWVDGGEDLKRKFGLALVAEVRSTLTEKTPGNVPKWTRTPLGMVLGQFKTFALTAHQNVMLRALDAKATNVAQYLVAISAVGMLQQYLRAVNGGEERFKKWQQAMENPGYVAGQILEATDMATLLTESGNMSEVLFGANPVKDPLKKAFPSKDQTGSTLRYAEGGWTQALGPSAGAVASASNLGHVATAMMGSGGGIDLTPSQKRKAIKNARELKPGGTWVPVRVLTNHLFGL